VYLLLLLVVFLYLLTLFYDQARNDELFYWHLAIQYRYSWLLNQIPLVIAVEAPVVSLGVNPSLFPELVNRPVHLTTDPMMRS